MSGIGNGTSIMLTFRVFGRMSALSVLAVGLLLNDSTLFAQETLRNLSGTVTDEHHEPLRGAIVEVENEHTSSVASYITDRTGHYSFKRLDGNTDYKLWTTFRGQRSRAKTLSQFNVKPDPTIDFVLRLP
jgi:hypothetical protein